ncbi:dipeptidase [Membranicola marinus]|uniref:Dipeptidase n=1 Tax=Membranihabitans marinus TaxID=1227546 RepID=A0A953HRW1_9BACT|nr:dipeptidase [Membranihabitans marinus]MBY5957141.1 dipeptidase [Membranihabitans marinus]
MATLHEFLANQKSESLNQLKEFLRIPSVSADQKYKKEVRRAAEWLTGRLNELEVDTKIYETPGHPIVYGEYHVGDEYPTVLFYGHYDVQPPDPLDLWETEPFNPVVKKTDIHPDGAVFARGACDDKGQLFMQVKAVEALINSDLLHCNLKFLYEGEEEVGSENLEKFCIEHTDLLTADVILISDTAILSNDTPTITTGLRGLSYVEVKVTGPKVDLHSGVYGGGVANPINVLAQMIAQMHDDQGRITIPGFYDDVEVVSNEEREAMNKAPFDLEKYKEGIGVQEIWGEEGYTTLERTSIRPTLDVNGIWGGYIGEGAKTVLPSEAQAKISMRLVPNQDPDQITELFVDYFKSIAPDTVTVEVNPHHGGRPAVTPIDSVAYHAASKAMTKAFGKEPIPLRGGGSIPIVAMFKEVLGLDSILMGFGLDSDAIHSPNEHFGLFNFYTGIETIAEFLIQYGKDKQGS